MLDPAQNNSFRDHYLGVPFDLSKVMFIATANVLDTIPAPLRDRMEIIELTGYTEEEKLQIAKNYLLNANKANGLTEEKVQISDEAMREVIADYTREAGVRKLEREIGAFCQWRGHHCLGRRKASRSMRRRRAHLGAARFESDVALRTSVPGVATGLAWTPVGGDILFVETNAARQR